MSESSGSGSDTPVGPASWGDSPPAAPPSTPAAPGAPSGPRAAPPSTPAAPGTPSGPPAAPGSSGWQGGGTSATPSSGCVRIALILIVLAVAAVVGLGLLASNFVNRIGGIGNGNGNGGTGAGVLGGECPFLSDSEAVAVLGGKADALELEGLFDASIGLVIDKRALAGAPDCWVTDGSRAYIARVAVYQGGDAASVFDAERKRAAPSSVDQGGGTTLESSGYFGGDVSGLGDAAFCTGVSDAIMAGVLVRQGDRVVYASVGGPAEGQQVPDLDTTPDGVITSPSLCSLAQELARAVLN